VNALVHPVAWAPAEGHTPDLVPGTDELGIRSTHPSLSDRSVAHGVTSTPDLESPGQTGGDASPARRSAAQYSKIRNATSAKEDSIDPEVMFLLVSFRDGGWRRSVRAMRSGADVECICPAQPACGSGSESGFAATSVRGSLAFGARSSSAHLWVHHSIGVRGTASVDSSAHHPRRRLGVTEGGSGRAPPRRRVHLRAARFAVPEVGHVPHI